MKRFTWRLQRVLDIKARQEQIKKAELFKLTEQLAKTRGELIKQKRILSQVISDIAEKKPKKRLCEQEFFFRYSVTTDEIIEELAKQVAELEMKQREKIAELLKLRRFKEGLEKLRDEAKREFISRQEKLEQNQMDEAAVLRFARKMMHKDKVGSLAD